MWATTACRQQQLRDSSWHTWHGAWAWPEEHVHERRRDSCPCLLLSACRVFGLPARLLVVVAATSLLPKMKAEARSRWKRGRLEDDSAMMQRVHAQVGSVYILPDGGGLAVVGRVHHGDNPACAIMLVTQVALAVETYSPVGVAQQAGFCYLLSMDAPPLATDLVTFSSSSSSEIISLPSPFDRPQGRPTKK